MPMSADHTVHLARAQLWADILAQGQVRGWSWAWFVGGPIGEFYPPLGDLLIIGLRALSFGLLSWESAYAYAFLIVFSLQGWSVMFVARRAGFPTWLAGLVAVFALLDPGYMREGGWLYTVTFGVWPQVFSTSLLWIGIGLCLPSPDEDEMIWTRARASALALAWGAALLAHPAALPTILAFVPGWLLFVSAREARGRQSAGLIAALVMALLLSAGWLLPMIQGRAWMASYGWLYASTEQMAKWALEGAWTHDMPASVGWAASVGLVIAIVRGSGAMRAVAIYTLGMWLLAGRDLFWWLRLDLLSEGFTHLQYQRFLLAAKPGFYLLAAWPLVLLWSRREDPKFKAASFALGLLFALDTGRVALEPLGPGIQHLRTEGELAVSEDELDQAIEWLNQRAREDENFWRIEYRASRNRHTLMDASPRLERPLYKSGFTPGDNFVHKPESGKSKVLDPLRVRYRLQIKGGERALPREVARFGNLRVVERRIRDESVGRGPMRARVRGAGSLSVVEADDDRLVLGLAGADATTEVQYIIGGHPRWQVSLDGQPLERYESPLWGQAEAVAFAERRAGALRGGKAHGDDGSEPTLLTVKPGRDGRLTLRYVHATGGERLLLALSTLAFLFLMANLSPRLRERTNSWGRTLEEQAPKLDRLLAWRTQLILSLILLAAMGLRWKRGLDSQANTIMRWNPRGETARGRAVGDLGPLKTDMLIRPAFRVRVPGSGEVHVTLEGVDCEAGLSGWIALDDDWAKQRSPGRFRVLRSGAPESEAPLASFAHRPGRHFITLSPEACAPSGKLVLELQNDGPKAHTLGLWLTAAADKVD
jgi:hypothetical protein